MGCVSPALRGTRRSSPYADDDAGDEALRGDELRYVVRDGVVLREFAEARLAVDGRKKLDALRHTATPARSRSR